MTEVRSQESEVRRPAKSFRDLIVWQRAHGLVLEIYKITERFPSKEQFGVTSQVRRAAFSVPSNIAEAFKARSKADKARILNIGQKSLEEVRYLLLLAGDLGYVKRGALLIEAEEVSRLLGAYTQKILNSDF